MSDKKDPTYISVTLSCDSETPELPVKAKKTLMRSLKISEEELLGKLTSGGIKLPRVRVSDKLLTLIKGLKESNVTVKARSFTKKSEPDRIKPSENEDITLRPDDTTEAWIRADWKKGDVIEGLYKVVGEDAGGMGKVFFVFHRTWRMMLAIKTPLPQAVKSPSHLARFMREAELWVDLGVHPNIATCYYARVINGLPRLFIEYVDGGTLESWINEKKIVDYAKAADVMLQFCYGMMHAEKRGMIHRDIKPANCLMTKDGALKITDFGLVKRLGESGGPVVNDEAIQESELPQDIESDVTVAEGGVRGSPWWMAPERFTKKHPVDIRSDIYSFGVMLYRLTVGVMPFTYKDGKDLRSLIVAHAKKPPRDALSIKPDLPKSLLQVTMSCLEKDPDKRPHSFAELTERMEAVFTELNGGQAPKSPDILELKTDSLNNQAVSLLDLGRYEEAIRLFEDSQSANPDHLETVYNLHAMRWKSGEASDQDLVSLMKSLKIEVRETPAFSHLMGLVYLQRGDSIKALDLLTKAFESGPEYRAWWMEQGKDPENFIRNLGYSAIGLKGKFGGHIKAIRRIGFGPVGDRVFSVGEDRSIRIWEVHTGRCRKNLRTFTFTPNAGAFSEDGGLGATCYGEAYKTVDIWDLKVGRPLKKCGGMAVHGLEISPDASFLAGFGGSVTRIWSVVDEDAPKEIELSDSPVSAVCFAEDGACILIAHENGLVALVDLEQGDTLWKVQAHKGPVVCMSTSDYGKNVFTGGADESIRVLELGDGSELAEMLGHRSAVSSVKPIPGSDYLVSVSLDGTIKLWDPATSRCFRTIDDPDEPLTCCDVSPDASTLVTGGSRGAIQLWQIDTRWFEKDMLEPAVSVPKTYVELSALHEEFISSTEDFYKAWGAFEHGEAVEAFNRMTAAPGYCWSKEAIQIRTLLRNTFIYERVNSASFIRSLRGHKGALASLSGSRDCLVLVTGGLDGKAFAWDVVTGAKIIEMELGSPAVMVYALPKVRGALTLSEDMKLRIWDSKGDSRLVADNILPPISIKADGKWAVAMNSDTAPVEINLDTCEIRTIGAALPPNIALKDFSNSLEVVHSVREGSRIQRWDLASGRVLGAYRDLGTDVTALAVMDSDKKLIAGTSAGDMHVYMVGSGINVNTIKAHDSAIKTLALGPTQDICVSGSDDCSAKVWNIGDSICLATLTGRRAPITALHFFRNGSMIASGDAEGSVRLWGLSWPLSDLRSGKRNPDND